MCYGTGQERELPDARVGKLGFGGGAGHTGFAAIPAGKLDQRHGPDGERAGVRFGCVLADAGYGLSAPFRQALSARGLRWAVGIPRHQKVYPADVQLIFPVAGRGRPRVRYVPDVKSRAAHAMLEDAKWRQVSWRRGTTLPHRRIFARPPAECIGAVKHRFDAHPHTAGRLGLHTPDRL